MRVIKHIKYNISDIISLYHSGASISYISRKYDCDHRYIQRLLKRNQIVLRKWTKINEDLDKDILQKYDAKWSLSDIAKFHKLDPGTIANALKKHGIKAGRYGVRKNRCRVCEKNIDNIIVKMTDKNLNKGDWICVDCENKRCRKKTRLLKMAVIEGYGGKCTCCGESEPDFLSIDHMDDDGMLHRKMTGGGNRLYIWLKKHNFPKEHFELRCMNCNWGRRLTGVCPHQLRVADPTL